MEHSCCFVDEEVMMFFFLIAICNCSPTPLTGKVVSYDRASWFRKCCQLTLLFIITCAPSSALERIINRNYTLKLKKVVCLRTLHANQIHQARSTLNNLFPASLWNAGLNFCRRRRKYLVTSPQISPKCFNCLHLQIYFLSLETKLNCVDLDVRKCSRRTPNL